MSLQVLTVVMYALKVYPNFPPKAPPTPSTKSLGIFISIHLLFAT